MKTRCAASIVRVTVLMTLADAERLRRAVEDGVLDEVLTPESRRAIIEAAGQAR